MEAVSSSACSTDVVRLDRCRLIHTGRDTRGTVRGNASSGRCRRPALGTAGACPRRSRTRRATPPPPRSRGDRTRPIGPGWRRPRRGGGRDYIKAEGCDSTTRAAPRTRGRRRRSRLAASSPGLMSDEALVLALDQPRPQWQRPGRGLCSPRTSAFRRRRSGGLAFDDEWANCRIPSALECRRGRPGAIAAHSLYRRIGPRPALAEVRAARDPHEDENHKPARDKKVKYNFTFFQNICSASRREDRSKVKAVAFNRSVLSTSSSSFSPRLKPSRCS